MDTDNHGGDDISGKDDRTPISDPSGIG